MLETAAIFERKADHLPVEKVQIDAIVELTPEQFRQFSQNMAADQDFISANIGHMFQDDTSAKHCLLVLGEIDQHGILVESEGYGCARYAAWLPNARNFVSQQLDIAARYIVNMGLAKGAGAGWSFSFGELAKSLDLTITPDNGIGRRLAEMVEQYLEVDSVIMDEQGLHIAYEQDYGQAQEKKTPASLTVRDLLPLKLQDFYLLPADEDIDMATIAELDESTLTPTGCKAFANVLDAEVKSIYEGACGLSVAVDGVAPERLAEFSYILAGYCPESDYRLLVNEEASAQPQPSDAPQL